MEWLPVLGDRLPSTLDAAVHRSRDAKGSAHLAHANASPKRCACECIQNPCDDLTRPARELLEVDGARKFELEFNGGFHAAIVNPPDSPGQTG